MVRITKRKEKEFYKDYYTIVNRIKYTKKQIRALLERLEMYELMRQTSLDKKRKYKKQWENKQKGIKNDKNKFL